jgi:hypothetical protein
LCELCSKKNNYTLNRRPSLPITTPEQDLNAILGAFLTPKAFQAPSLFVK